ncbi:DUF1707 domain-containing protein [Kribbella sp. NPDC004536]|uniref:DUF1707 SHOCT-like domain-containing protein n=1 Tax=Kribbella sp. NPDC004536 TaxID=3364106 RepID=UPI003677964B
MNEERPGGPIRIGDREREDAVKRLGEHYEAGRLTTEEHSDRVDQALKAKTEADLREPFADLPGPHQPSTPGAYGAQGAGAPGGAGQGAPGGAGYGAPGGEPGYGGAGYGAPGAAEGGEGGEGWAGPWGWRKPPWTAPENSTSAGNSGPGAGSGGFGGPGGFGPGAGRGFVGRMPLPLLIMLGVFGVLASIGCVLGAGHPPILPILLVVAAVYVIRKRRTERRA